MKAGELPSLPENFFYRLDLRGYVTPRLLKSEPIHRWFWFPHSFSPQLLDEILKVYPLPASARILDPFVGAGTTVLRAKQLGYSATGCDLSPLSIFVSRTKLQNYNQNRIYNFLEQLNSMGNINKIKDFEHKKQIKLWVSTPRLRRAFTFEEWQVLGLLYTWIHNIVQPESDLFLLAWLKTQQIMSRAVPDGGWFRWVEKPDQSAHVLMSFINEIKAMLHDLQINKSSISTPSWSLYQIDSRELSTIEGEFDMIITSPPYPNRHDYSRVFHLALLGLGLSEEEIFALRYRSLRSHVEAHAPNVAAISTFSMSQTLSQCIDKFPQNVDPRIPEMLAGYFEDMALSLNESWQVLKEGGICVLVVGNVRHAGVMVPVDEILVEVATSVGFAFDTAWVARLRGNSAQQMARFGKEPSRETILFFRKK